MSNPFSAIYSTIKAIEQEAAASLDTMPAGRDFADAMTNAVAKFEALVPYLATMAANKAIEAVPFIKPLDGAIEGVADPLITELAKLFEGHLLGKPATVAPGNGGTGE